MQPGLVSCITPVRNGEAYLAFMLDSILTQTYPYIEMILVNDGSTDRTAEIAESYRERFAKKGYDYQILHMQPKCAAAAMNRGLPLVRGEYLIWPDSDDILEADSVQKRVEFLKMHPEYACVRSLMYYFNENGRLEEGDERIGDLKEEKIFWDILVGKTFVCCGCYMLRAREFFSIYPKCHIPEYPVGQNFQMLLPYMYHHRCHTIPERLYGVRVHPYSHSRRRLSQEEEEKKFWDFERMIDEIGAICGLSSLNERRKIMCWKLERRRKLARKYGQRGRAAKATVALFLYGRSRFHGTVLNFVKGLLRRDR